MAAAGRRRRGTSLFLPVISVLLQLAPTITNGADSLSFGQYLSGNQTLVSKQGVFELGFFRPGSSTKQYLGMWYKNIVQRKYLWVANRNKPVSELDSASVVLRISGDGGTFGIFTNASTTTSIWSSSPSTIPSSSSRNSGRNSTTRLLLLDTGNLVLVDGNSSDPSAFLWESFDHPTDTFLPGTKIGYNHTSGKSWSLASWKSSDDPSPGSYTAQIDPSRINQYILVWNVSGQPYWSTGAFKDGIFANVPEMMLMQCYGFTTSDPSDTAARYVSYVDRKPCWVSVLFVDSSGLLKWQQWVPDKAVWQVFIWMPRDPCQVPSHCGAYGLCFSSAYPSCQCLPGFQPRSLASWGAEDYTAGCVRKGAPLTCGTSSGGDPDGFFPVQAVVGLPDANTTALQLNNISSGGECEAACLRNCSCTAYSFDNGSGCQIWSGDLMNLKQVQQGGAVAGSSPLQLRLASSELKAAAAAAGSSSSNKKQHNKLVIGLLSGVLALLLLTVLLAWWWCCRRNRGETGPAAQGFTVPYRYEDLQKATKNFTSVLGKGGFGSVYRGTLRDDTTIAVKTLTLGLGSGQQGDKQFRSEVRAMATIQHINILPLRGFCCQGPQRILVYDYMPNGSLDSHLFPVAPVPMPWEQRYTVGVGVARGLAYLHDKCRDRIVHCDIKPENILLDADMCPKVADFGMAKLIGRDFSCALTTMRGTIGYLAPEWISGDPITDKADVYSYGMMLFEIVSGRRNREPPPKLQQQSNCNGEVLDGASRDSGGSEVWFFPMWAATNVVLAEDLLQVCESSKADHGYGAEELRRRAWRVAWWCVQDREEQRPTMAQVIQMLEGVLDLGVPPIPTHLKSYEDFASVNHTHVVISGSNT